MGDNPAIDRGRIRIIKNADFNTDNVCLVTGCGSGFGRAVSIVASANNLMTVGLDCNEKRGSRTQKIAREMGGQMIFIKTDLTCDADIEYAVGEATKMGSIKYLANTIGSIPCDRIESYSLERFDALHNIMVRSPFYLCQLVISQISKSNGRTGVIGNLIKIYPNPASNGYGVAVMIQNALQALTQAINIEEKGRIRYFTTSIEIEKNELKESKNDPKSEPLEVANNFILKYSQAG